MATRRQREAAAPRPAANAGPSRNQTAAAAARSGPSRNQMAAAAARSGPRNQMAAATARSGPRNQTAAAAAAPSGPRNQTVVATVTGRPHARNRRALGDIGNHVNAPVVDREANRRCLTRSLSARPNAAAADENTIARARPVAAVEGARASRVGRAVSGKNKKLSKGATTRVTSTRAEMDTIVDDLTNALAVATKAVQNTERTVSLVQRYESFANQLHKRYEEIAGDYQRLAAETTQLVSEKAQKEAQVQQVTEENVKVMEENVRLRAMLDKKEALLQAMSEQCKFMALNHHN